MNSQNTDSINHAIPLTDKVEPLVEAARPVENMAEDIQPLPRSQSLAVQNYGLFAKLGPWFRRFFYKPPTARKRKDVEMTRKQLKDLRRQITVMERTLGRLS